MLREPDLFIVKQSDNNPPDAVNVSWVLEIVSPGAKNRERDLIDKRRDYARAKVREYWIVDPEEQIVSVLALDGETYRVHGDFKPGTVATSLLLPEFQIDVAGLFASAQ